MAVKGKGVTNAPKQAPKAAKAAPVEVRSAGKRRPKAGDLDAVIALVSAGWSLRKTCEHLGLDTPSTHTWLDADDGRRQQYARAREQRADHYQEKALDYAEAAALGRQVEDENGQRRTLDPGALRVLVDTIKWATARMAPKTAPVQRHDHTFGELTDDELEKRIAALQAAADADDEQASEP